MDDRRGDTRRGDTVAPSDVADGRCALVQMMALLAAAVGALALGDRDIASTLAGAAMGVAVPRRGATVVAGVAALLCARWVAYG
jgi:hypothetical protein